MSPANPSLPTQTRRDPPQTVAPAWELRTRTLSHRPVPHVMGIVNVTPDSFSDGGQFANTSEAIEYALKLADQGASIVDIGGESTRPYSTPVETNEEIRRIVPVIREIVAQSNVPISVDTSKSAVALAALDAGAEIINDVTGLTGDPKMVHVARHSGAGICAMHMQGTPQTMQDDPQYENVIDEILDYLNQRKKSLLDSGIQKNKICLDPGIGFGKTHQQNIRLLNFAERFHLLACPLLIGHSRKGFIGHLLDDKDANRDAATLAISMVLAQKRIQIIRVHDVEQTIQAFAMLQAIA